MFFSDIPGKEFEKKQIQSAIKSGRLAHAQLYLGRAGSGQLALAIASARFLMCLNRGDRDSCGTCSSCIKVNKLVHPDLHFTFPVIKKDGLKREDTTSSDFLVEWRSFIRDYPFGDIQSWMNYLSAENSQPNINVKECTDIVKKLSLKTFESDYKVLILWMPEYLGREGNRLLKLIEEPPENTVIILVAEDQDSILNTVLSRTQILKVAPFTDKEVIAFLNDRSMDGEMAHQIAGLSGGNMNLALELSVGKAINFSEELFTWLRLSYAMEPVDLTHYIADMSKRGRSVLISFIDYGLFFLQSFFRYQVTGQKGQELTLKEWETAEKMKTLLTEDKIEQMVEIFESISTNIQRNANVKILFMAESLNIGRVMRSGIESKTLYKV